VGHGAQRVAVVGCGINVLPLPEGVDQTGFASGYACLRETDPAATAPRALMSVAAPLVDTLQRFALEGLAPFAARFAARDLLRGRTVTTSSPDLPEGRVEGIDGDGALLVRAAAPGAALHRLNSGEVSVRPSASKAAAC
jgi:BirA family biotin operon repressor/biotin-[acetyl-CoA-carboxylase] ligase